VTADVLATLPDRLRDAQRVFSRTGGLHAAGLFTADGDLVAVREDVGRHNAVDKIAGWALLAGRLPLAGHILLVSGRASFELVQKAVLAGIPVSQPCPRPPRSPSS
jgi:FdhD protein